MELNISDKFRINATRTHINKVAVILAKQQVTYGELWHKVECLAAEFIDDGMQKGERVVICTGNRLETIVGFWAVTLAGGVVCIISDEQQTEKIEYVVNDSEASFFVSTDAVLRNIESKLLHKDSLLRAVFSIDSENLDAFGEDHNVKLYREIDHEHLYTKHNVITQDLATIIYTSGSTGEPKGVMMTHGNMMCARDSVNEYLENREEDIFASALPLSFDYGLYQMIMSLSIGATLLLEKDMVWPLQFMKNIIKQKATNLAAVPLLVDLFTQYSGIFNYTFEDIRYVSNTGAALGPKHFDAMEDLFPNAVVFSMFGLTECKRCTYLPPADLKEKQGSVGIAIPNTEISVVNDEGQLCKPFEVGQLLIRGETIMQGYWKKPDKTAEKLGIHPVYGGKCLYTGDYGFLDEDGYFFFKGRMDEVFKIRGRKLVPKEVEDVLSKIEGMKESAVICIDLNGDIKVVCFLVFDEALCSVDAVRTVLKSELEAFQIPSDFVVISSMPRSLNGKIDKQKLQADYIREKQPSDDIA